ncbi:MAG: undecaprenyl-diphosphate phosphatase, partial [Candidatus Aminicenantes bacterium]|nr:undecaprenyl-diphosphate phosphatase [Candidatus Aminicenantes bacterium]
LGLAGGEFQKMFEVVIQAGAILAVVWLFRDRLKTDRLLLLKTGAAFLPTAVLGALLYRTVKSVFFEAYTAMVLIFIAVGVAFLVFELLVKKGVLQPVKDIAALAWRDAFLIGLFQAASFLPGVSRAGAVILTMMVLGYKRSDSAFFSFFLSIPTLLSAGLYDLYKSRDLILNSGPNALLLAAGLVVSFIVAFFAMKWLIGYLQRHSLALFGWYRIAAGLGTVFFGLAG